MEMEKTKGLIVVNKIIYWVLECQKIKNGDQYAKWVKHYGLIMLLTNCLIIDQAITLWAMEYIYKMSDQSLKLEKLRALLLHSRGRAI